MPSPGGRWLRSEAEQTDEGRGAVAVLMKLQSYTQLLPCPHPPLRGTFPQGKAWGFPHIHGFPYEGKLSAVRLTDEVDSAAQTQVPPPHPSRLRRATFPS